MLSERMEQFKLGATIGRPHSRGGPAAPGDDCRDDTDRRAQEERTGRVIEISDKGGDRMREPVRMLPPQPQTSDVPFKKKLVYDGPKSHAQQEGMEISRTISADSEDTRTTAQESVSPRYSVAAASELETIEEQEQDEVTRNYQNFVTSMPKTWSGSSLSFIKFLLFVKETDASFIPEMDRMLSDYDKLVSSLTKENKDLKGKLKSEVDSLKKRVHDKKKLVNKLTKKLTECQGYITELADELERVYKEKGTVQTAHSRVGPRPDDITVASATSEITMEREITGVESTLSRMLAEERSKADTLEAMNKNLVDDLSASKKELDDLEKRLDVSEEKKIELEGSVKDQWEKLEKLIFENKGLYEDLAGVVIEMEDNQEEFTEREGQLIEIIEANGSADTDELEATIEDLREELSAVKESLEMHKGKGGDAAKKATNLSSTNDVMRKLMEEMERRYEKEIGDMKEELEIFKERHEEAKKELRENTTMVDFAREIVDKKKRGESSSTSSGGETDKNKDRKILELERQLASLRKEDERKSDAATKCMRDTMVFLYDAAAGSNEQDPSELLTMVRETSKLFKSS